MGLFPIDSAESYLRQVAPSLVRKDKRLRWECDDGVSELSVTDVDILLEDGFRVRELVILSHTSPQIASLPSEALPHLNSWATLSALVRSPDKSVTALVSKVGVFDRDKQAAELVYAPLLCTEAAIIGWHAARLVRGQFRADHRLSPLPNTDMMPDCTNEHFKEVLMMTDRAGYVGSLADRYVTVELPWDEGATTAMARRDPTKDAMRRELNLSEEQIARMGGRTSLLQIACSEHPLYGMGVTCTLELPFDRGEPGADSFANALNIWDRMEADLPPLFGAWCLGPRAVSFASFLPTAVCRPGLLQNLAVWMVTRHHRVRQMVREIPPARNADAEN
jgi:hypothetical protein